MLDLDYEEDITGRRFAFAGRFTGWPPFLGLEGPEEHIRSRGGRIVDRVDDAQYLVVGRGSQKGRAAAVKRAEALRANGGGPKQLDERDLVHLLRPRLAGRTFHLIGGFSTGLDIEGPTALVEAVGARVVPLGEAPLDFAVVGERRAKGKAAALRQLEKMEGGGQRVHRLDEEQFLALLACVGGADEKDFDVRALTVQLRTVADPKKVGRAIQMLKKESFQLYAQATETSLGGVVRSQTHEDAFYGCWIDDDGHYACFDGSVTACWGQSGGICKHTLVLLIGLSAEGEISPRRAYKWALAASSQRPVADKQPSAELILKYRGAQAGEVDWRPTETVPEDYYAL